MGIIRRFRYWALIIVWFLIIYVLASIFICIIEIYLGKLIANAIASLIAIALAILYSRRNLPRRLSLYFSGYVRPPFMLVIRRRPGKLVIRRRPGKILKFLSNTFFKPKNPGPPPHNYRTACYLWPDRLRWHFFMFALLIVIILRIDGAWFLAPVVAIFLVLIIPWITYTCLRSPVLESLWRAWPPFMDRWFEGLADLEIHRSFPEKWNAVYKIHRSFQEKWNAVYRWLYHILGHDHRLGHSNLQESQLAKVDSDAKEGAGRNNDHGHILQQCRYLPPFCEKWDAVYWSPQGSPRDSLLRAAINEMFSAVGEEEISWHDKAFRRWIFYWCAPVWGSYIALLLLLIPQACNCSNQEWVPQSKTLYFLVWIWILFGEIFIWREKSELSKWSELNKDNRNYLPSLIYRYLKDVSDVSRILSEPSVKLVLSLIGVAGISAYLSFVNILYPLAVEVKNKEPIEIKTLNRPHKEMNNNTVITKVFHSQ